MFVIGIVIAIETGYIIVIKNVKVIVDVIVNEIVIIIEIVK